MIHSIKRQIAFVTFALILTTLFLCWGINNIFLEKVYYSRKESSLLYAYSIMNEVASEEELHSEEFRLNMEELCDHYNLSVMIVDSSLKIVYSSANVYDDTLMLRLFNYVYGDSPDVNGKNTRVLEETEEYRMLQTKDMRFNTDYIEMLGSIDCGDFFVVRTGLENIRENVKVSNRFLGYIVIVTLFFSMVCIMVVSEKITRPLNELIALSRKMTNLDFNAKYTSRGTTEEIDSLGENMNLLSEKLEETISDLKTANNELKSDIEKKVQIDQMRKEFLSNVSHELKTPIALIQGYAEGLQECINDDAQSREFYCDVIIDEARKMNGMVQKLLTLNQIEFGNDTVTMERFDITTLVRNLIQSMSLLAEQKEVTLTCNTDEAIYVWADEYKVDEVLTNYLSNALNHVENEMQIEVKIQKQKECVRISVFNTGKPIPEEDLDKIWIKFYKVDKARTREYGGSGIGLSIVKAIMDSLHQSCGAINYENGVEFWFTLESAQTNV